MSILLTPATRAIIQGITGRIGTVQAKWMQEYGTNLVAGVTPGNGGHGREVHGLPVYDNVADTVKNHGADATVLFVPAPYVLDAVLEAIDAGIKLIVCVPEHVPVKDTLLMRAAAQKAGVWLVGPNTPGIISPGAGKLGIMPGSMFQAGRVGLISRSGTLAYEVAGYINAMGLGQSTMVGIGGDPVRGSDIEAVLAEFDCDDETDAVVLVGEIGGTLEEDAAAFMSKMKKPMIAYIAGSTAPAGRRMGHAGAIISGSSGTAAAKLETLRQAGVLTANRIAEIPGLLKKVIT